LQQALVRIIEQSCDLIFKIDGETITFVHSSYIARNDELS